jgi:two-component system response regulator AtoC
MTAIAEVASAQVGTPGDFHGIVGTSPAIRSMTGKIAGLATSRSTVLIVGESGTGKELVARAIHSAGGAGTPFVALNCAALPKDLIESELFGYVRGAFSGAHQEHLGLFRSAQGGIVFLDEITEMNPETQAKLLRVIQERCVRPVGGMREIGLDVRIIASTNRDPEEAVRDGYLRKDLYYRLAVGVVQAAPLRDRIEDIPQLARHFIALISERLAKNPTITGIDDAALDLLCQYSWPGNVRELSNAIEIAVTFATSSVLRVEDFSLPGQTVAAPAAATPTSSAYTVHAPAAGPVVFTSLKEVEREHIAWTLYNTGGNKALAARLLGISRKNLYDRLAQHGLGESVRNADHLANLRSMVARGQAVMADSQRA